ncbi:MAG: deacetylase [Phycisphaerales bacterium]|nr:deacetylase [Phycisphaerales bacterium]
MTIDTEGDNLWSRPREITTRNAAFLPRFQQLCERYGQRPTWLTNWEMACCPVFTEFARDVLRRGTAEIGMHLHAWNQPPLAPLSDDDGARLTYLIEYPEPVLREKVRTLTDALEQRFGVKMRSHRAGRWAFNELYARVLVENGYDTDCSVTPHVSWTGHFGATRGGSDYRGFPETAYFVDLNDIRRPGRSPLLELPMTILPRRRSALLRPAESLLECSSLGRRFMHRLLGADRWLRPNGRNRRELLSVLDAAQREQRDYVEYMLHSSEYMPGGSPIFPDEASIERLYADLEALFAAAAGRFTGMTLSEYHDHFVRRPTAGARVA